MRASTTVFDLLLLRCAIGFAFAITCDVTSAESEWTFDFSGHYRIRLEDFEEPFVGLNSVDEFTSVAHRLLGGARIQHKDGLQLFAQVGVFREDGREPTARAVDEGDPDIQQLFVDFRLKDGDRAPAIRLGRQDLTFGASRLVSTRDSPNIRRSFDALKLTFPMKRARLEAFIARPVELKDGAFDDRSDGAAKFWGVYGSIQQSTAGGYDIYYLGFDRDIAVFDQGTGSETRHTLGVRHFGKRAGWDWDGEAAVQIGEFDDDDIHAWFVGGEVGRSWTKRKWNPRVAFRTHVFSGDSDPTDSDLQTFNPLFPKTTFFTQMGLFSPSNAIDLHPLISFSPIENLRVTASIDFFWRFSTDDALYRPPLVPRIAGNVNSKRFLGTIWEVLLKWSPTQDVDVTLAYDVGNAQGFVAEAGGEDPRLFLISARFAF